MDVISITENDITCSRHNIKILNFVSSFIVCNNRTQCFIKFLCLNSKINLLTSWKCAVNFNFYAFVFSLKWKCELNGQKCSYGIKKMYIVKQKHRFHCMFTHVDFGYRELALWTHISISKRPSIINQYLIICKKKKIKNKMFV